MKTGIESTVEQRRNNHTASPCQWQIATPASYPLAIPQLHQIHLPSSPPSPVPHSNSSAFHFNKRFNSKEKEPEPWHPSQSNNRFPLAEAAFNCCLRPRDIYSVFAPTREMEAAPTPRSKRGAYCNALFTPLQRPPSPWTSPSPRLLSPSTRSTSTSQQQPQDQIASGELVSLPSTVETSEREELQRLVHAPPFWKNKKKLSKQLSMCETARDRAWEKRRGQMLRQERRRNEGEPEGLTDEDLNELKACIELGFGFKEEEIQGVQQRLCSTLPALDLYFAVNRQLSASPVSTPRGAQSAPSSFGSRSSSSSMDSPKSEDSWRICGPGDSPEQVKTRLRHWAQAVACSVMQST